MPFESEDQRHLAAAQGYVELGMLAEANEELEQIDADVRHLPEVLEIRVRIYSAVKKWDLMQVVARQLAQCDPSNVRWTVLWAIATRRADCLEAARLILINALQVHPGEAILHYNLACYECQLGDIVIAKRRLSHAIDLDKKCKNMALDDPDLEPLWEYLNGA